MVAFLVSPEPFFETFSVRAVDSKMDKADEQLTTEKMRKIAITFFVAGFFGLPFLYVPRRTAPRDLAHRFINLCNEAQYDWERCVQLSIELERKQPSIHPTGVCARLLAAHLLTAVAHSRILCTDGFSMRCSSNDTTRILAHRRL